MENNRRDTEGKGSVGDIESSFSLSSLRSPRLCGEIFYSAR
jgi:hypothetical protein